MISKETGRDVNNFLSGYYGSRWNVEIGVSLFKEFQPHLTDKEYREAIQRHLRDPEKGRFPPLIADINDQLRQIAVEAYNQRVKIRATKEKERLEAAGQVLQVFGWREELARCRQAKGEILKALGEHLGLDFHQDEDCQIREILLAHWRKGFCQVSIEEILAKGQELLAEREAAEERAAIQAEGRARMPRKAARMPQDGQTL